MKGCVSNLPFDPEADGISHNHRLSQLDLITHTDMSDSRALPGGSPDFPQILLQSIPAFRLRQCGLARGRQTVKHATAGGIEPELFR
ncbi:hypothetical protein RRG08_034787 [Elysia crispata]|uniref:Uncharacterized protein n=1 Tax=Elysia crispata TaxID=231223 RepID=A0AAE1CVD5_9GAST|nr:hypothetical protein RRG08_034787 [Elysia crispata]